MPFVVSRAKKVFRPSVAFAKYVPCITSGALPFFSPEDSHVEEATKESEADQTQEVDGRVSRPLRRLHLTDLDGRRFTYRQSTAATDAVGGDVSTAPPAR